MVFLEQFRQYGIFWTIQTVWYFRELFRQYSFFETVQTAWDFWNCSDNMVFFVSTCKYPSTLKSEVKIWLIKHWCLM
jgi:hypothetical protein